MKLHIFILIAVLTAGFGGASATAATGLTVTGFDLGAQGEALRDAPNGCVVPLGPIATAPMRLFASLRMTTATPEVAQ